MKLTALDIMKFRVLFLIFLITSFSSIISQVKREQELRIDKKEFPSNAIKTLEPYLVNTKKVKYYKEFDAEKTSYEAKFKKDRLKYNVEFNEDGILEDIEFIIHKIDIPESALESISSYLSLNHKKYKIKKIQQQYLNKNNNAKETLKVAFQNLILKEVNYELIVSSKSNSGFSEYEISFNADGKHILSRKSIKTKYDHILY